MATDEKRREEMKEGHQHLPRPDQDPALNAGIITDRTRAFYAMYVDMDELKAEGDTMVGDAIADEGIKYLQRNQFPQNRPARC